LRAALVDLRIEESAVGAQLALLRKLAGAGGLSEVHSESPVPESLGRTTAQLHASPAEDPDGTDGRIQPPLTECGSQHDWILSLLRTNPRWLKQEEIVGYLAPRIKANATSPEKAIGDALSHLAKARRIKKANGAYPAVEDLAGRLGPG
jgi:hypothetical protein